MHAIRIHKNGGTEVMQYEEKLEIGTPKPNEVLIKIEAIGVNFIDTYHRTGLYQVKLPFILGREAAGVLEKVGEEVKNFQVGDRVVFMAENAYAEYTVLPATKVVLLPQNIPSKIAAASYLQGLTAHYLTNSTYPIQQGDWVLVHAGAGGTCGLIIEMAKIRGAKVIATVSSQEKADIVKQLGADHAILYTETDFMEEVKKITGGKGVNVVYDGVGLSTWEKSLKSLKPRGMLVLFGNASGAVPAIDPLLLSKHGSLFITRPTLVDYIALPEELEARCKDLFGWIQQGKVTIRIAQEFPLSKAADAHDLLTSRKVAGKILLIP